MLSPLRQHCSPSKHFSTAGNLSCITCRQRRPDASKTAGADEKHCGTEIRNVNNSCHVPNQLFASHKRFKTKTQERVVEFGEVKTTHGKRGDTERVIPQRYFISTVSWRDEKTGAQQQWPYKTGFNSHKVTRGRNGNNSVVFF